MHSVTPQHPASSGSHAKISLHGATLTVHANLQRAEYAGFQRACNDLRLFPEREVTIDLARCTYGSSSFIGDIVEAVTQMKADGKKVTVLVSPELGRLLHMAHLYHLFAYTIVDTHLEAR
ncbi:MAG TPA: STAS domain-containing protein [Planctomycetota bacterium]|nr:STAS domain-containing protein [Planctomycetota bacterium]